MMMMIPDRILQLHLERPFETVVNVLQVLQLLFIHSHFYSQLFSSNDDDDNDDNDNNDDNDDNNDDNDDNIDDDDDDDNSNNDDNNIDNNNDDNKNK